MSDNNLDDNLDDNLDQKDKQDQHSVIDPSTLELLGSAPRKKVDLPIDRMNKLRSRVMNSIDAEHSTEKMGLVTIRSTDGTWVEIFPKIEKKVLYVDRDAGTESYLLRVQPGAEAPAHYHEHDELCLMLEGEISYGDFSIKAGDYHFAPKGSQHEVAYSNQGALLYIQTGLSLSA